MIEKNNMLKKIGAYTIRPAGKPPKYDHSKIKELMKGGARNKDIAQEMGCNAQYVSDLRVRWGLKNTWKIKTDKQEIYEVIGCKKFNVCNYVQLLKMIQLERKSILELSRDADKDPSTGCKMVAVLEKRGFVEKVFMGNRREIVLTERGNEFLKEVEV